MNSRVDKMVREWIKLGRSVQIRDRKSIRRTRRLSLQANSACLIALLRRRAGRHWPSIDNRGRPSVGRSVRAATLRAGAHHVAAGRRCSNLCVCIRSIRRCPIHAAAGPRPTRPSVFEAPALPALPMVSLICDGAPSFLLI